MAGESDIAFDYTTGGWTCSLCGAFVKPGAYHDCEYMPAFTPKEEIIELLKRIIELIEKEL